MQDKYGVEFSDDGKILVSCPTTLEGTYKIPDGVEIIGNNAFNCCELSSIKIPESVKRIRSGAFISCARLKSIKLPEKVTNINGYTFQYCTSLKSVKMPGIRIINYGAFNGCKKLKTITIPENITKVASLAFYDCPLEEVHIKSETPEVIYTFNGSFGSNENKCTLYVPKGSIEKYQDHSLFSKFKNIVEE